VIRTVDYRPLTDPVQPEQVRAFKAAMRGTPGYSSASIMVGLVLLVVIVLFMLIVSGGIFAAIVPVLVDAALSGPGGFAVLLFPALFIGVIVAVLVIAVLAVVRGPGWEARYRMHTFAQANGLVYSPADGSPSYPGAIFATGSSRMATDHFRSAADRFLDYGNYRYTTGSGKNSTTHRWGFLALELDRSLPHMVLDSKSNNGLFGGSNLPAVFAKDQVLSLEGDFDRWFTLYCPRQYERDALTVFTPDLMALLIDEVAPFDVEIVDRWMFVYSARELDMRQPAVHQRMLRIVDTVGGKTLSQTDRYRDERVETFAANIVAPQGRRLKRGVSVGAVVTVAVFVAFWLWGAVGGMLTGG
jgi:hypothetical protein